MPGLFQQVTLLFPHGPKIQEIGKQPLALLLLTTHHQVFQHRHFRKRLRIWKVRTSPWPMRFSGGSRETSRPEIHSSPEVG